MIIMINISIKLLNVKEIFVKEFIRNIWSVKKKEYSKCQKLEIFSNDHLYSPHFLVVQYTTLLRSLQENGWLGQKLQIY